MKRIPSEELMTEVLRYIADTILRADPGKPLWENIAIVRALTLSGFAGFFQPETREALLRSARLGDDYEIHVARDDQEDLS